MNAVKRATGYGLKVVGGVSLVIVIFTPPDTLDNVLMFWAASIRALHTPTPLRQNRSEHSSPPNLAVRLALAHR
jgi:hypothetical protein